MALTYFLKALKYFAVTLKHTIEIIHKTLITVTVCLAVVTTVARSFSCLSANAAVINDRTLQCFQLCIGINPSFRDIQRDRMDEKGIKVIVV